MLTRAYSGASNIGGVCTNILLAERHEQVHPARFTVEPVVAMAPSAPARIINRTPKIGTLPDGAPGDIAIMELVQAQVSFVDTRNNKPRASSC